jgi:Ni/Fe-hydrogenase 1 B-type cytochrome subunit
MPAPTTTGLASTTGVAAAAPPIDPHEVLEPVYVWDVIVRVSHWLVAISLLFLVFTGIDIARPFLDSGSGRAGFTHGWVRVVHFYAAQVFSLAVGARIVWMFAGPRRSGWHNFVPASRRRIRGLWQTIKFYLVINPKPPDSIGHNPMAGLTYLFVFALYVVMILSGFALYSVSAYTSYMHFWSFLLPLFDGPQGARWVHHVTMWLLLMFAVFHVFAAILTSLTEKNGCVDSIFSGYKYLPRDRKPNDDVD